MILKEDFQICKEATQQNVLPECALSFHADKQSEKYLRDSLSLQPGQTTFPHHKKFLGRYIRRLVSRQKHVATKYGAEDSSFLDVRLPAVGYEMLRNVEIPLYVILF